nr:RICIN domain-containing protein [uncultured Clostridium sp.]
MKNFFKRIISFTITMVFLFSGIASAAPLTTARVSVHDPSVVRFGGKYYIFGSHMANAVTSDLASWKTFTTNINNDYANIFSKGGAWAARGSSNYNISGNLWAPDVIYNKEMKKWCMYMSVNGSDYYSSIALATADSITGPYTYSGTIVYSGFRNSQEAGVTDYKTVMGSNTVASRYVSNGAWNASYGPNAIDPCVLYDKNGQLWMSYGSWFGGIFMLKLDNRTGLRDYSNTYPTKSNSSDQYFGIRLSGGYGCTGEGSYIVWDKEAGYYYMYLSYCGLNATDNFGGYHMRAFRSQNITGPYKDAAGNAAICTSPNDNQTTKGVKLMGNYALSSLKGADTSELSRDGYMSPGHNSAFIDDNGQRYLVYHTRFNTGEEYHQVRVHQQFLNQDKWPVTSVYEYLGSQLPSNGYPNSEIIGTYDFINHGNSATTAKIGMLPTYSVTLKPDGSISGSFMGTWSAVQGTSYCTMKIDNVTYKGVFFKQYDESSSHKNTMTFSLIGSNDQAIWGSKTSGQEVVTEGYYYIKSSFSNLYLDVENGHTEDGSNIRQFGYNGSSAQKFKLVSAGNGYYYLMTGASGYKSCVDVENGDPSDGTNVMQWTYWGGDMQKFKFVPAANGTYAIMTNSSSGNSCLDVYNMSKDPGGNVVQWNYWDGEGQHWYLESTTP